MISTACVAIRIRFAWYHKSFPLNEISIVVKRRYVSTEGAFATMAQVATINYELPLAKLSVNERSGQVILSVQTPADEGLTRSLVRRAILELCTSADKVQPILRRASQGDGL